MRPQPLRRAAQHGELGLEPPQPPLLRAEEGVERLALKVLGEPLADPRELPLERRLGGGGAAAAVVVEERGVFAAHRRVEEPAAGPRARVPLGLAAAALGRRRHRLGVGGARRGGDGGARERVVARVDRVVRVEPRRQRALHRPRRLLRPQPRGRCFGRWYCCWRGRWCGRPPARGRGCRRRRGRGRRRRRRGLGRRRASPRSITCGASASRAAGRRAARLSDDGARSSNAVAVGMEEASNASRGAAA